MHKEKYNKYDFDFAAERAPKKPIFPQIIQKYNPFKMKKNSKKRSLLSTIIIIIEISFILVAFVLALKRAIKSVIHKNDVIIKKNIAKTDKKNIKLGLCTSGRNQNRYVKEFVQFYEKLGVDKIFLYDNNDKDGENFKDVINDYISKNFVEISNLRGERKELLSMMDDCYKKNYDKYDWLIFYDLDEYIHLQNYQTIKQFLNEEKFDNCQKIYLNWVLHTDNDLLHYEDKPLQKRFPTIEPIPKNNNGEHNYVKSIIRGHIKDLKINNIFTINDEINGCNGNGKQLNLKSVKMEESDYEKYYIDHYFYKSLDEFVEKLNSGDADLGNNKKAIDIINDYFTYNKLTLEKIEYIEKKTKLDLSKYKTTIKSKNKKLN